MRILMLGGAGAIGSAAAGLLARSPEVERLVIADLDVPRAEALAAGLGRSVDVQPIDAGDGAALVGALSGFDVVANALPGSFSMPVLHACLGARVSAVTLTSGTEEYDYQRQARAAGIVYLLGCGATPGITNLMAARGAARMEQVESFEVAFAAFRPLGLSRGLVDTTLWEFDPETPLRVYYEDGMMLRIPPFHGERIVDFPPPIGPQPCYHVPHGETRSLPQRYPVRSCHTRGCFHPQVMRLLRVLAEFGLLRSEMFRRGELAAFLAGAPEAKECDLWGYALSVEVTGREEDRRVRRSFGITHPPQDIWGVPGTYANNVGFPFAIGTLLVGGGAHGGPGVAAPEGLLDPGTFFERLRQEGVEVFERREIL